MWRLRSSRRILPRSPMLLEFAESASPNALKWCPPSAPRANRLEVSLEKLVDVLLAENISTRALLERDLALIKVSADQQNRPHLMELIKVFRARVVDVAPESLIIEVSGTVDKIDGLLEVLRPFGVLEMARTGRISMTRGGDLLQPPVSESSGSQLESTGSNAK